MDLWQRLLKLTYGINPSDWRIIGRWFIYVILKQKIYNPNIENEKPFKNELLIGWIFHYFIGVVYSLGFFILMKYYNIFKASLTDGLIFGLVTLIIPWFFMLPAIGKGFLALKTLVLFLLVLCQFGATLRIGVAIGLFFRLFGY